VTFHRRRRRRRSARTHAHADTFSRAGHTHMQHTRPRTTTQPLVDPPRTVAATRRRAISRRRRPAIGDGEEVEEVAEPGEGGSGEERASRSRKPEGAGRARARFRERASVKRHQPCQTRNAASSHAKSKVKPALLPGLVSSARHDESRETARRDPPRDDSAKITVKTLRNARRDVSHIDNCMYIPRRWRRGAAERRRRRDAEKIRRRNRPPPPPSRVPSVSCKMLRMRLSARRGGSAR